MPAVSVIMPCYNAAAFLERSIGSVLGQTFHDWELIAVNDGSTDHTAAVLEAFADARIRVVHQENRGLSEARNTGIRAAEGRYLAFLDADDSWHEAFLATMVAALEPISSPAIAYCGWQNLGLDGGRGKPFVPPDYETADKMATLLGGCRWPVHAALITRELAEAAGGFDPEQRVVEDFDFWLRTASRGRLVRVPRVLAYYHHHGQGQLTQNRAGIARFQIRAVKKFLRAHPEAAAGMGRKALRQALFAPIRQMGYEAYWKRDLPAARAIFRMLLRHGYATGRDWLYMLPALLPLSWHRRLLYASDGRKENA